MQSKSQRVFVGLINKFKTKKAFHAFDTFLHTDTFDHVFSKFIVNVHAMVKIHQKFP